MAPRRKTKNQVSPVVDPPIKPELEGRDFIRLTNNFYTANNYPADYNRIIIDSQLANYIAQNVEVTKKKQKVAMIFICLNPLYWEFARTMVEGARQFFLPGHNTDFLFWTDIPENPQEVGAQMAEAYGQICARKQINPTDKWINDKLNVDIQNVLSIRSQKDIKVFPTDAIEWPFPTLLRYNLFMQQEELLKEYDYIYYCDIDMRFVNVVGDEILGQGLTAAQHPMYALGSQYWPPYEPNSESEAYIPRPGKVVNSNGKPRFMPLYYAGGFQGGKSEPWLKAMREMKQMTDKDLNKNYIPIWNDESIWNKYLFLNPPDVVLTPAYIYPDSIIKEYYEPLWGCAYIPKLMTLTKWFSTDKAGGDHVAQILSRPLK